jgi:hypothetical protein
MLLAGYRFLFRRIWASRTTAAAKIRAAALAAAGTDADATQTVWRAIG